ncbi:helix-turn-helix domain-containing protein, partial [Ligilactobacillus agilis]
MTKILKREADYPITIPAKVRFDLRLTANEKLLYGELYTFGGMAGTFTVSNQRLAALYHVTVRSISAWLNKLAKCGYIELANSLDKNERIISFVPGVDPLDRDGYLYDEEVGHEEVVEAVAEPADKYDYTVDTKVDPEVIEAEMTARFGPIPDHLTPKQKAELREFRRLAYNKLHSKNSYDPKLRKEAQLGKALYAEEKITEFFNKLKSKETEPPLEKQIYMMKQITEQANKEYDWLHEDEFE